MYEEARAESNQHANWEKFFDLEDNVFCIVISSKVTPATTHLIKDA